MMLPQIVVIHRLPPKKRISTSYAIERKKVDDRRRKAGRLYFYMEKLLNSTPGVKNMTDLRNLTASIASLLNLKIDRAAKRSKEALTCWLCENWDRIQNEYIPSPQNLTNPIKLQNLEKYHNETQNENEKVADIFDINDDLFSNLLFDYNNEEFIDQFINEGLSFI